MKRAIDHFQSNMLRVKELSGIRGAITNIVVAPLDLSDILRAEFVLAVSAFDNFVHEVTRFGMLEIYESKRPTSDAYLRFQLPLVCVNQIRLDPTVTSLVDAEIQLKHSYLSFQMPDKVADAIRLVSDVKLWEEVSLKLGVSAQNAKEHLKLIVDRRNRIAHEADTSPVQTPPLYLYVRYPISETDVAEAIGFLEQVAQAIYDVIV